jgi:branched-chain amino acid transport system ATP-binding protein
MSAILRLESVLKRFGAVLAADHLSLELAEGEALGVIGPNGSGKTTMFNIITGMTKADSGRVFFNGTEITNLPAFERCRRGIARSFQIPHPFVGMTVYENLLVAAAFGQGKPEHSVYDRCVAILEETRLLAKSNVRAGSLTVLDRKRLELARALATNPKVLLLDEIAGGQQQMVSIGRALMANPQLLLCDEISLGLAPVIIKELYAQLGHVTANGTTLIIVEQDIRQAMAVSDRVYCLREGRVALEGRPSDLTRDQITKAYFGI